MVYLIARFCVCVVGRFSLCLMVCFMVSLKKINASMIQVCCLSDIPPLGTASSPLCVLESGPVVGKNSFTGTRVDYRVLNCAERNCSKSLPVGILTCDSVYH